ncbi:hypothetical protein K432DRAFT_384612 [Lepidopterella palustris CBS 459.81]|uniref:Uncharacterized protein n=1 Tax=Lepidopterella palustris CBS 459.81 TaxID=1314670 RepID=A0A8E2E5C7_9PEZI|nr:hypothetical protein K432DRAFT_384612 [Lepidopterella palustris CBS 459.81]
MPYPQASLLLFLTCLFAFTSAGQIDIGGMFLPRDLFANIKAKPIPSLLPRADTQITVSCAVDYGYDLTVAEPPDMVRLVRVFIGGLPDADNHVDVFKKEIEDACLTVNLKDYTPDQNLAKSVVAVSIKIRSILQSRSEEFAPPFCQEEAIKKFTGLTDFVGCDYMGF